jgi:DNA-binding transcriptional LysR family regulator
VETSYLRTFLMVADTGSMAEAARRLDLTATSVAQQLRSLERDFGAPLLARAGRTVQLTAAGHQLIGGVRDVLRNLDQLRDVAISGLPGQLIRLGAISTALQSIIPDTLARLIQQHPQLQIQIEQDTSMNLYESIQRGDLDAAFCIHPHFPLPKTFGWRTLRKEHLVVLVPARLARRDPHEVLRSEPLIRYGRSHWGGKQAERYLLEAGITPTERVELTSLTTIAMLVDRGLGVSLVPDSDPPLPAGVRIAKLQLPRKSEERHIGLLWLRSSAKVGLVKLLIDAL